MNHVHIHPGEHGTTPEAQEPPHVGRSWRRTKGEASLGEVPMGFAVDKSRTVAASTMRETASFLGNVILKDLDRGEGGRIRLDVGDAWCENALLELYQC